ncbi:acetolactate decarboxylase [Candidatus Nanopelagicales bacterium]|nr:acetolactate decarboxylase [Candidatus Nanopelagicales bacterium]
MTEIALDLPPEHIAALKQRAQSSDLTVSSLVAMLLAEDLGIQHSTIYQVSTATALVQGVYQGAVTVANLKEHGDFGLGTFADLAGEMVVLDGHVYCVPGDGPIREADNSDPVPFVVVSQFSSDTEISALEAGSFADLTAEWNKHRPSENEFCAVKLTGTFSSMQTRAVCKVARGTSLEQATKSQAMFDFKDVTGTIVGYWFPEFAGNLNVIGWHLHFIDDARTKGGHVLQVQADGIDGGLQVLGNIPSDRVGFCHLQLDEGQKGIPTVCIAYRL